MPQSNEMLGVLVTLAIASGIAGLIYVLNAALGPKRPPSDSKLEPFECGVEPITRPTGRFSIKFYLVAMLFILFDVEIVWFFPWAVVLRELGWPGIVEMFAFVFLLALGFAYAWKKGALQWEK